MDRDNPFYPVYYVTVGTWRNAVMSVVNVLFIYLLIIWIRSRFGPWKREN